MSYCRFSSDDFQCDVYVYQSGSGFEVHTAGQKQILTQDQIDSLPEEFVERYHALNKLMEDIPYTELTSPEAGKSWTFSTAEECIEHLEYLRTTGLRVPQYAIDDLREENG